MTIELVVRLLAGLALLAMNGFFVTTEFALTRVRQFSREEFDGSAGLRRAWEMTEELEIYLSGCQVGITISSVALGVVAEPAVTEVIGMTLTGQSGPNAAHSAISVGLSFVIINLLHVILAEQVPTYLGVERTKTIARYLGPLLYVWVIVLGPVIRTADWISKRILGLFGVTITRSWREDNDDDASLTVADIRREMGQLLRGTTLSEERQSEILNALEIGRLPVDDIMIPSERIIALTVSDDPEEFLDLMQENPHTRYPLLSGDKEQYIGIVYSSAVIQNINALQTSDMTLGDIAEPLLLIHPDMPVSNVIDTLQANSQELALVSTNETLPVDTQHVSGLVTATDAFEAITGDIEDPYD